LRSDAPGKGRDQWTAVVNAMVKSSLRGIDYTTGKIKWSRSWEGTGGPRSGVLSTAGNLVFAGDPSNNLVAVNATTGQPLWNANRVRD